MTLGEIREKTKHLSDDTIVFTSSPCDGGGWDETSEVKERALHLANAHWYGEYCDGSCYKPKKGQEVIMGVIIE